MLAVMAKTVQQGSGSAEQPGGEATRP